MPRGRCQFSCSAPVATESRGHPPSGRIVAVNDQHAHLELDEGADVQVGDMIALGVSHPCTTFDKWRLIPVVDDNYAVVSAVETFF